MPIQPEILHGRKTIWEGISNDTITISGQIYFEEINNYISFKKLAIYILSVDLRACQGQ